MRRRGGLLVCGLVFLGLAGVAWAQIEGMPISPIGVSAGASPPVLVVYQNPGSTGSHALTFTGADGTQYYIGISPQQASSLMGDTVSGGYTVWNGRWVFKSWTGEVSETGPEATSTSPPSGTPLYSLTPTQGPPPTSSPGASSSPSPRPGFPTVPTASPSVWVGTPQPPISPTEAPPPGGGPTGQPAPAPPYASPTPGMTNEQTTWGILSGIETMLHVAGGWILWAAEYVSQSLYSVGNYIRDFLRSFVNLFASTINVCMSFVLGLTRQWAVFLREVPRHWGWVGASWGAKLVKAVLFVLLPLPTCTFQAAWGAGQLYQTFRLFIPLDAILNWIQAMYCIVCVYCTVGILLRWTKITR